MANRILIGGKVPEDVLMQFHEVEVARQSLRWHMARLRSLLKAHGLPFRPPMGRDADALLDVDGPVEGGTPPSGEKV